MFALVGGRGPRCHAWGRGLQEQAEAGPAATPARWLAEARRREQATLCTHMDTRVACGMVGVCFNKGALPHTHPSHNTAMAATVATASFGMASHCCVRTRLMWSIV